MIYLIGSFFALTVFFGVTSGGMLAYALFTGLSHLGLRALGLTLRLGLYCVICMVLTFVVTALSLALGLFP